MRELPRDLVTILRTEAKNQRTPPIDYVIAEDGGRMVHTPEPDIAMAELLEEAAAALAARDAELVAVKAALSGDAGELIDKMAEAIRDDGGHYDETPWDILSEERKEGWRSDARRALAVVKEYLTARIPASRTMTEEMADAPERIRVAQDADGFWTCREAVSGSQEYVRADLYAALEAKLAARTGGVKVKALEWEETHTRRSEEDPTTEWDGGFEADSALGYYKISMGFGSDAYYWAVTNPLGDDVGSDFEDPSYAKAAAQADYERRILSALEADDERA